MDDRDQIAEELNLALALVVELEGRVAEMVREREALQSALLSLERSLRLCNERMSLAVLGEGGGRRDE